MPYFFEDAVFSFHLKASKRPLGYDALSPAEYVKAQYLKYYCMFSYRGWYKFRKLPMYGQRTWTNARGPRRAPDYVKSHMMQWCNLIYGSGIDAADIDVAYRAEMINDYWMRRWSAEWSGKYMDKDKEKEEAPVKGKGKKTKMN